MDTRKSRYRGRPIKFRGQLPNGKFVFGDVVQWGGFEEARICSWDNGVIYDIEPDSVRQLVGYDKHGNEVYEGDVLVIEHCQCKPPMNEYIVEFKVHGYKHGASVNFETNTRNDVLKEVKT